MKNPNLYHKNINQNKACNQLYQLQRKNRKNNDNIKYIYQVNCKKLTNMNSPKFKNAQKPIAMAESKDPKQIREHASESLEIKPWNSNRLAKMTARMTNKKNPNDIFSLSNRSSYNQVNEKNKHTTLNSNKIFVKPRTAGYRKSSFQTRQKKQNLSQQMVRLGPVVTEQVLDDKFQQNLQTINFYPQFRASLQQRRNLMYLKPYMKSTSKNRKQFNTSTYDGMQKLKTELYKSVNQPQNIYQNSKQNETVGEGADKNLGPFNLNTNRSVIQYLTQYEGNDVSSTHNTQYPLHNTSNRRYSTSRTNQAGQKIGSISVLRQKLRNRYKSSTYADKIVKIKKGEGVPITIIQ